MYLLCGVLMFLIVSVFEEGLMTIPVEYILSDLLISQYMKPFCPLVDELYHKCIVTMVK